MCDGIQHVTEGIFWSCDQSETLYLDKYNVVVM